MPGSPIARPELVWPAARLPVRIEAGAVHVWGLRLDSAAGFQGSAALLSPEERARAERFVSAVHRDRFVQAHAGLRRILSGYLGVEPAAITLDVGAHGKPRLSSASGIEFNLTHAHDLALLAVGSFEVGVDVEFIHPVDDGIAERFFSKAESEALGALPEADQLAAFFAVWTRKEAFLKGLGTGIPGGLDSFTVTLPGQGQPRLSDAGSGITAGWSLVHLEPAVGYVGAVAIRGEGVSVRCFSFEPEGAIGS